MKKKGNRCHKCRKLYGTGDITDFDWTHFKKTKRWLCWDCLPKCRRCGNKIYREDKACVPCLVKSSKALIAECDKFLEETK